MRILSKTAHSRLHCWTILRLSGGCGVSVTVRCFKEITGNVHRTAKQLILEVENPDYETREDKKVLMHRRIAFYQKNGMQLSGVTCNFMTMNTALCMRERIVKIQKCRK